MIQIVMGTPGTTDFLSRKYPLPASYTQDEYMAALNDLRSRWEAGERSGDYAKGFTEGAEMAAYLRGLNDGLKD